MSSYISGFVAKKVASIIDSELCKSSLTTSHADILTRIKDLGNLTKASDDVVIICNETEKTFRQYTNQIYKKDPHQYFITKVKLSCTKERKYLHI